MPLRSETPYRYANAKGKNKKRGVAKRYIWSQNVGNVSKLTICQLIKYCGTINKRLYQKVDLRHTCQGFMNDLEYDFEL